MVDEKKKTRIKEIRHVKETINELKTPGEKEIRQRTLNGEKFLSKKEILEILDERITTIL